MRHAVGLRKFGESQQVLPSTCSGRANKATVFSDVIYIYKHPYVRELLWECWHNVTSVTCHFRVVKVRSLDIDLLFIFVDYFPGHRLAGVSEEHTGVFLKGADGRPLH